MTSRILWLLLSISRILLCFPIISIIKVAWIWSPISFYWKLSFPQYGHFHALLNRLNQGTLQIFSQNHDKGGRLGWIFKKSFGSAECVQKLDGQERAGDGFGDCYGFARLILVQKADWFSGYDRSLTLFAIPQPCGVKNPSNDIVLSLWLYSIVLYQKVE